jgi:hypothetical protein
MRADRLLHAAMALSHQMEIIVSFSVLQGFECNSQSCTGRSSDDESPHRKELINGQAVGSSF